MQQEEGNKDFALYNHALYIKTQALIAEHKTITLYNLNKLFEVKNENRRKFDRRLRAVVNNLEKDGYCTTELKARSEECPRPHLIITSK